MLGLTRILSLVAIWQCIVNIRYETVMCVSQKGMHAWVCVCVWLRHSYIYLYHQTQYTTHMGNVKYVYIYYSLISKLKRDYRAGYSGERTNILHLTYWLNYAHIHIHTWYVVDYHYFYVEMDEIKENSGKWDSSTDRIECVSRNHIVYCNISCVCVV